jgi:hypothetical protein
LSASTNLSQLAMWFQLALFWSTNNKLNKINHLQTVYTHAFDTL